MNVLVVGAGEMGQWFGQALHGGAQEPPTVAFTDADPDVAAGAAETLDGARAVPLDADDQFDVVCIAVPIPAATDAIETHAPRAESALVDVTGVATEPVDAMATHAPGLERLSLHPLFAAANSPGNVAVVPANPGPTTDAIRESLTESGNTLFETTAGEHDEAMETVQARAHAAILAFGLAAADVRPEFQTPISGALSDLLSQVTAGEPRVYADIQAAFDGADDIAEAAAALADADTAEFTDLYEQARTDR